MSSPPNRRIPSSFYLLKRRRPGRMSTAIGPREHYITRSFDEPISDSRRRGTSSATIEPTTSPSTANDETGTTTTNSNPLTSGLNAEDDCAICRDRKVNQSYLVPCMHTYCFECILRWVRINPTCPLCKANALKIIHSINSDTDYGEYEIRRQPQGLPVGVQPSDIHIHSNNPHMFFAISPDLFATQMTSLPIRMTSPIDLSTHIPSIDPRIEALLAITMRSLRSPMSPDLLRRLMCANRMCSFPTSSNAELLSIRTVTVKMQSSSLSHSSQWTRNLEQFCRREISLLVPWVDYTPLRRTTQLNVACKPIGAPPYCVGSGAVKSLSRRIIQHIYSNPGDLNNINVLASSIHQLDGYASGGEGIFDFHNVGTLKRLAWEIKQFCRYQSGVDEYYREMSLFSEEVISQVGDPVLSNALYLHADRSGIHRSELGFRSNFDDVCRSTVRWLFRKLFGGVRTPYIPPATLNSLRSSRAISASLKNPASDDPRLILRFPQHFEENRRNGIRGLLSLMVRRLHEPTLIQPTLCELIDLARVSSACSRVTALDRTLLNRRIANLVHTYSQPVVETGAIPDVTVASGMHFSESNPSALSLIDVPSDGGQNANPSEPSAGWIVLSDSEENSDDIDNDAVEVLEPRDEESQPQSAASTISSSPENSQIPPCCAAHTRHCCCCQKRSSDSISALFQEFLDYCVRRKKRRRMQRIELNTPNSPIIISDDETPEQSQPVPGPSTRSPEIPPEIPPETLTLLSAVQKIDGDCDSPEPVLERPQTAAEFYTLLKDAMNCDTHEGSEIRERTNLTSSQPQSSSNGASENNDDLPSRPTSAPTPLSPLSNVPTPSPL
ncbi:hypothetical protein Aperf_G00000085627 [Anoplocephala perfoliata]